MGQRPACDFDKAHVVPSRNSFIRKPAHTLCLTGTMNDTGINFVIDSGSTTTIVADWVLTKVPVENQPKLEATNEMITLADGRSVPVKGRAIVLLCFGPFEFEHSILFAPIDFEGLLGNDFMDTHECCIDYKHGCLTIDDLQLYYKEVGDTLGTCRVKVSETTEILPGEQIILPAKIVKRGHCAPYGLIESSQLFVEKSGLLIGKSLVKSQNKFVPLQVLNISDEPKIIYKDTNAALYHPIQEVVNDPLTPSHKICVGVEQPGGPDKDQLPEHLYIVAEKYQHLLTEKQNAILNRLLLEYQDIFSTGDHDIGHTSIVKHKIDTGSTKPIKQYPRRLPINQRKEADEQISDMLNRGVIKNSNSPWASPIVLVKKKDGSTRFCVDYRKLNEVTRKDAYPLPRIDDSLDSLSGAQWFSTLDLCSGYWQVEVDENDQPKTAFTHGFKLYEFALMPYGLCNAPSTFERLMEMILHGLQWETCLIYLDDIIIFGNTFEEELERLREVFSRLRKSGLKLKPKKCSLFQKEVLYLGHVVSNEGISTDPQKTEAVKNWPVPSNIHDVRSFVGLCSYYRRFIQSFAKKAHALHRLTEKGQPFIWTPECQDSFNSLKESLLSAPILGYPMEVGTYILDTDACDTGIGAVLNQVQCDEERVIAYASKSLTKPERKYCVTRKELLAVVYFVKYFRHYLYGQKFIIRTDHAALKWLTTFKNPEGQVARWLEILSNYDFVIEHRPGKSHGNADAMSRHPCHQCGYGIDPKISDSTCSEDIRKLARKHKISEMSQTSKVLRARVVQKPPVTLTWLEGWSPEKLKESQLGDPNIAKILQWKNNDARPAWEHISHENRDIKNLWAQWKRLILQDGILYRRWENEVDSLPTYQLILPKTLKDEVLTELHSCITAGHLGVNKTLFKVRKRFYWPNMNHDVKMWILRCDKCARRKTSPKVKRAPLKQHLVGAPMERVAIDIMGPLPISRSGNRYIMVIVDYFTKWVEAYAIPNQEAFTVAEKFVNEFVTRFGVPRQLHTDQGSNFESYLFQEMTQLLGIDKTRTTPFHPSSDGLVERFNRTIESMLSMFTDENQTDWDEKLPCLLMAYRGTPQESTQCSPNLLMLGRETELPIDLMFGRPSGSEQNFDSEIYYVDMLQDRIEHAHAHARKHLEQSAVRQKRNYDHNVKANSLKRGDQVWLYTPVKKIGLSPKLQCFWDGPYAVLSQITDQVYKIKKDRLSKPKIVHRDRLNRYCGDVPSWLHTDVEDDDIPEDGESVKEDDTDEVEEEEIFVNNDNIVQDLSDSEDTKIDKFSKRVRKPPERYGAWVYQ